MRIVKVQVAAVVVAILALAGSAFGQHDFTNTRTVDSSGFADETSIQAAIDFFGTTSVKKTVLIYAGEYNLTTPITLNADDENIDLVGIDRESVIISVSGTGQQSGIVITSGTETSRNSRIANLTIITTNGHGIEIVKGTAVPKDITIEGVTIRAGGDGMNGMDGAVATDVRVFDCDIETEEVQNAGAGGYGMDIGDRWTIQNVTVNAQADAVPPQASGIRMTGVDGVTIENSQISSTHSRGLWIIADSQNVTVRDSQISGGSDGVRILLGDHILLDSCHIVADNSESDYSYPVGLFYDRPSGSGGQFSPTDIVAVGCRIEVIATSASTVQAVGVQSDTETFPRLLNCEIIATAVKSAVYGVYGGGGMGFDPNIVVIGGSITTRVDDGDPNSNEDEKQTEVWDLRQDNPTGGTGSVLVSGTRMSKWSGPIQSAERPRAVIQRTIDVSVADDDGILTATGLTGSEQPNTTPTFQPDVYRVLSVTGNKPFMFQDVYIIGTDWADNDITDKIQLNETTPRRGVKPFKTVTKIILPAQNNPGETVTVGTTTKLGLYYPIASTSDVLEQGRKSSGATSYTLESISPTDIDVTYSTVQVSLLVGGVSFEWAILASQ